MTIMTSSRPQLAHLTAQMEELKQRGTYFKLRILDDEQAAICTYDGKKVINLASNNYLGLCNHPKLREAAIEATRKYGVGSGAVRTIAGTMRIHMELEEKIAAFKNVEACVVFSMDGDIGPVDKLSALAEKYGAIMMVDDAHASGVLGRNGRGSVDHFGMHG